MEVRDNVNVTVFRITSYSEPVYVSEKAKIKPKALHIINKNTEDALEKWGIPLERKPKVVITSIDELNAYGKYDAVLNTVYYIPQIVDKEKIPPGDVEFHEMWHLKQAEDYQCSGKTITRENKGNYIAELCKKCKSEVDELGITEYTVK